MSTQVKVKKQFYIFLNDKQVGPASIEEIKKWRSDGTVAADTLLWCEGMKDWLPLKSVPEFASTPPPMPRVMPPPIPKVSVKKKPPLQEPSFKVSGKMVSIGIVPLVIVGLIFPNFIVTIAIGLLLVAIPQLILQKLCASNAISIGVGIFTLGGVGFVLLQSHAYLNNSGEVIPYRPTIENMKGMNSLIPRMAGANGRIEWKASGNDTYVYIKKPSSESYLKYTLNPSTKYIVLAEVNVAGKICGADDLTARILCMDEIVNLP